MTEFDYSAKVLCDSVAYGTRLVTLEVTMPRFILAEFNTHRVFSRNSASSRAIPVERRVEAIRHEPFVPVAFAANKRGMQAGQALDPIAQAEARKIWLAASRSAARCAEKLAKLNVHKQWANRLVEPYAWHTVVCTSTQWENFFNLRAHPDAQPEIQEVARLMAQAMFESTPRVCENGDWHLPYVTKEDFDEVTDPTGLVDYARLCAWSTARCARVSYITHDTSKRDILADQNLHDKLRDSGHMSPFEHCAQVVLAYDPTVQSNFDRPWLQYRKTIPGEAIFQKR